MDAPAPLGETRERRLVGAHPNGAIRPLWNSAAPVDSREKRRASGAPAGADDSVPGCDHSRCGGGELLTVVWRKTDLSSLWKSAERVRRSANGCARTPEEEWDHPA